MKVYLTEAYSIDDKSILRILTQNKQINKADPDFTYYGRLAKWANENGQQQKLKNIDLNTIKLSNKSLIEKGKLTRHYTTLGHLLNTLKTLMEQEGKYNTESVLSQLIQQTTLEILAGLSKIKNNEAQHENTEEESAKEENRAEKENVNEEGPEADNHEHGEELHAGMDWTAEKARRLENAKDPSAALEKFYNDYYSIEYAGATKENTGDADVVAKLKSLDKILIPEFNALGYNTEINPLARFLKNLIEYKPDIFNKLSTNNYGAIHNSFIAKHITGNMLGKYDEYKNSTILYCSDLYNYKGLDIVKYLDLQEQALTEAKRSNKYSDDKDFIAKMFIQQQVLDNDYAENVRKLFDEPVTVEITSPGDPKAKLKSELEIQELYRHLFKSVLKKAVSPKVAEEILERAKHDKVVLSMIRYILDQDEFANSRKYAKFAQDTEKWLKTTIKYNRNDDNVTRSEKILDGYVLDATAENLIVRTLREYVTKVRAATKAEAKEEADK